MKLNAGIVTPDLKQSVEFYTEKLGFGITFMNEWYALLHTPGKQSDVAFLLPGMEAQHPLFREPYTGKGIYFTIEVENVDEVYEEYLRKGIPIQQELKSESWGERHFVIRDPNGIGIDIVTYTAPAGNQG